ncbi:MAG: hypothetical protein K6F73_03710 [Lachnospiraceae bacterium]|nr:hypothetical protein [Lachnospiraceae bacterium]
MFFTGMSVMDDSDLENVTGGVEKEDLKRVTCPNCLGGFNVKPAAVTAVCPFCQKTIDLIKNEIMTSSKVTNRAM